MARRGFVFPSVNQQAAAGEMQEMLAEVSMDGLDIDLSGIPDVFNAGSQPLNAEAELRLRALEAQTLERRRHRRIQDAVLSALAALKAEEEAVMLPGLQAEVHDQALPSGQVQEGHDRGLPPRQRDQVQVQLPVPSQPMPAGNAPAGAAAMPQWCPQQQMPRPDASLRSGDALQYAVAGGFQAATQAGFNNYPAGWSPQGAMPGFARRSPYQMPGAEFGGYAVDVNGLMDKMIDCVSNIAVSHRDLRYFPSSAYDNLFRVVFTPLDNFQNSLENLYENHLANSENQTEVCVAMVTDENEFFDDPATSENSSEICELPGPVAQIPASPVVFDPMIIATRNFYSGDDLRDNEYIFPMNIRVDNQFFTNGGNYNQRLELEMGPPPAYENPPAIENPPVYQNPSLHQNPQLIQNFQGYPNPPQYEYPREYDCDDNSENESQNDENKWWEDMQTEIDCNTEDIKAILGHMRNFDSTLQEIQNHFLPLLINRNQNLPDVGAVLGQHVINFNNIKTEAESVFTQMFARVDGIVSEFSNLKTQFAQRIEQDRVLQARNNDEIRAGIQHELLNFRNNNENVQQNLQAQISEMKEIFQAKIFELSERIQNVAHPVINENTPVIQTLGHRIYNLENAPQRDIVCQNVHLSKEIVQRVAELEKRIKFIGSDSPEIRSILQQFDDFKKKSWQFYRGI